MKRTLILTAMLVATLTFTGCSTKATNEQVLTAPSAKVQQLIDQHKLEIVDYEYVKMAIGNGTRKGAKAILVDARPNSKYVKGTIPSSYNVPDTKFDDFYGQLAEMDKNKETIVFCGGWKCAKSPKVAAMLMKKGFTNVKVYQAGEPEWKDMMYSEVDTAVVQSAMDKNSATLIDARPYKKFLQASIPGALAIPDTEMDKLAGRFPANKEEKIITFCGGYGCAKSHKVADKLMSLGYKNVFVYAGGVPKWKKDGMATTGGGAKKVATDEAPTKAVVKNGITLGADEGTVDGEWFKGLIVAGKVPANVQIVDVVPTEDFANGHLPGAINIQAESFDAKALAAKLPKDKVVVFNCTSGARALEAWAKLSEAKYDKTDFYYFDANINCVKDAKCEIEVNEPLG